MSGSTLFDGRSHITIRELRSRSPSDLLLEVAKTLDAPPDLVKPLCALGYQAGHGLVVAGNHDFFPSRYTLNNSPKRVFAWNAVTLAITCP